ncbi:reticulocyte-binding protein 2 homolog a-like [Oreochromis aureus]|uniref:reticulocyte-binding protein 2 homolog a-like n=1 Tax=Oreochromis aureus TaxID=47969 RepID=UPI0019532203|nr:reticulocyte-binding protein 2 homolog a-like [Oreochromis aureus]
MCSYCGAQERQDRVRQERERQEREREERERQERERQERERQEREREERERQERERQERERERARQERERQERERQERERERARQEQERQEREREERERERARQEQERQERERQEREKQERERQEREREEREREERERELEREREREKAKKLQKERQEKMKADLRQKIDSRDHKMAEVKSSEINCNGSLDAEWLEINSFFSQVMKIVEDAKEKACQALEDRRRKVKREAQDLTQELQREIDVLKKATDDLDNNPDLELSPVTGLKESADWKNLCDNTSLSFGTLRGTTSAMMKQIDQEIEKHASKDLKRISTFAVDVKLDPTSAHSSLVISDNGKKVRNGGKTAKDPDSPQRSDMFGSVLGLNRLKSGRSYWEVEVSNKTGWDLGVARCDGYRKGKFSVNPDKGYWVTAHYGDKKYAARTIPPVNLSFKGKPRKVGVFVDYEEGLVSFYDVMSQSHIYSFTECSFGGEILPYFRLPLKPDEKNSDPLIISAMEKQ